MDLSSSLSGSKEFRIVKRGYDPDEVDAFLDQIALGVAELKRKLSDANDRVTQAPEEGASSADAEEIHRALILAQRAAADEVRSAREEGERIVADARARAADESRQADAELAQARAAGRGQLEEEITELEGTRTALQNDVVVLERHVEEQREVVQAAIGELQSLLDHPDAFRVTEATGLSEGRSSSSGGETVPLPEPPAPAPAEGFDEPEATQAVPAVELLADDGEPAAEPPAGGPADAPAPPGPPPASASGAEPAEQEGGAPAEPHADDDDFLAELRKAMHDEEPLGPRDESQGTPPFPDQGDKRSLFGRRR